MDEEYEDEYEYYDDYEEYPEEEEGCPCGYFCFDCLGMSWRDFM